MDKHPVSRLEYQAFLDQTGHTPSERWGNDLAVQGMENHPAVGITWQDVIAYAEWSGKRFPIPNEWEKAAFGINGSLFPWGDEYHPGKCNILESNIGATTSQGANSPQGDSPYGICDLFGNVWEWVYDWTASTDTRMLVGGAWDTPLEYLLPPYYAWVRANPGLAGENFGFRLVVSLDYQIAADALSGDNHDT
jgi:formylglycine-generating enzyme required for sulfatase activity